MRISDWSSGVCSSDLHPRRPPGGSTSASPRGWRLRRSPGCWSWVRDRPGHDRGEPKDTPMKQHRHARPDAGVSSSAAPIATSDTRERLRPVLDTPADLPALRTHHHLPGPGSLSFEKRPLGEESFVTGRLWWVRVHLKKTTHL